MSKCFHVVMIKDEGTKGTKWRCTLCCKLFWIRYTGKKAQKVVKKAA